MSVAVVIPCYKVRNHILDVIARIGPEVAAIFVVDDCCPVHSGELVAQSCADHRVRVFRHAVNEGVGGATLTGYAAAINEGHDVIVKVDGDGQMDPELIPQFIGPILSGNADYTKGNRFYDLTHISRMPGVRLFGNAVLSFFSKLSSGYWDIFDPTNGYTAIHAKVASHLPQDKISKRYFFESDMLFRLNLMRSVVVDVPMDAQYGNEKSNLKVSTVVGEFLGKHLRNFGKRIFYNYFLRDVSPASLNLVAGTCLSLFGAAFGLYHWADASAHNALTPAGTVMLAALPLILGLQFLLAFLNQDIQSVPRQSIHQRLHEPNSPLPVAASRMSHAVRQSD